MQAEEKKFLEQLLQEYEYICDLFCISPARRPCYRALKEIVDEVDTSPSPLSCDSCPGKLAPRLCAGTEAAVTSDALRATGAPLGLTMLQLEEIKKVFAEHLALNPLAYGRMDDALAKAAWLAYTKGLKDGAKVSEQTFIIGEQSK